MVSWRLALPPHCSVSSWPVWLSFAASTAEGHRAKNRRSVATGEIVLAGLVRTNNQHHRLGFYGFFSPQVSKAFIRFAFDVDGIGRQAQVGRHVGNHGGSVRSQFG